MTDTSVQVGIDCIAIMIDRAGDEKDVELSNGAVRLIEQLRQKARLTGVQTVLLHYYLANACQHKRALESQGQPDGWKDLCLHRIIYELLSAVNHKDFASLQRSQQNQCYINLANALYDAGRIIDALPYWNCVLKQNPQSATALGRRGCSLYDYAALLNDKTFAPFLATVAYNSLSATSRPGVIHDGTDSARQAAYFKRYADHIAQRADINAVRAELKQEVSLGDTQEEKKYRSWCLNNTLFLNPVNDAGVYTIAAEDTLNLFSVQEDDGISGKEEYTVFGFYNQLKQEFISARWLYYEGITDVKPHFSDKNSDLYDILNIPSYSLGVEKIKLSYRAAYSLFDKIAFFINDYFTINMPVERVTLKHVWYDEGHNGEKPALRQAFTKRKNKSLQALFCLFKDLQDDEFVEFSEPGANSLANIRDHLERKYCQVYEDSGVNRSQFENKTGNMSAGFRIGRTELEVKTLSLLRLARAALIYLLMSVMYEERERHSEGKAVISAPLSLVAQESRTRLQVV